MLQSMNNGFSDRLLITDYRVVTNNRVDIILLLLFKGHLAVEVQH